jgi:hypothetical protein
MASERAWSVTTRETVSAPIRVNAATIARTEQGAAVERVVDHAVTLCDQALAHPEDVSRWQVALAAVEQAAVGDDATARDRLRRTARYAFPSTYSIGALTKSSGADLQGQAA